MLPVLFCFVIGGGAKVLGKLPVPGRPTDMDYSRARAYLLRLQWVRVGVVGHFTLVVSLFFLPVSERRPDID